MPVHASIKYISIFFLNGHSFFISDYILCIKSFKYFCIFDFITYFTHNSSWVYEVFKYLSVQWIFILYSLTAHTRYQVFQVFLYILKLSYIIYTPVDEYIKYLSIFFFKRYLFFTCWLYILCIKCFKYFCIFWIDNILYTHQFTSILSI